MNDENHTLSYFLNAHGSKKKNDDNDDDEGDLEAGNERKENDDKRIMEDKRMHSKEDVVKTLKGTSKGNTTATSSSKKQQQLPQNSPDDEELASSILTFASIFSQAKSIIIYNFSLIIYTFLARIPERFMVTVLAVEALVLWMGVDSLIRSLLTKIDILKKRNRTWYKTIHNLVDSISTLGVFILLQLFLSYLTKTWSHGTFNISESFTAIYIVAISIFALFQKLVFITS